MSKKLLSIILSVFMLAGAAQLAFAEDVFVTKYGKKYHKEGSRFIKDKDVEKMTREEAEERGYKPSSDFMKEDAKDSEK